MKLFRVSKEPGHTKSNNKLMSSDCLKFKKAAINYPKHLSPGDRYYLYVKPFDGGDSKDYSADFFYAFASVIKVLSLPVNAKILDVACGPGWLSEFLARSGYDVTGIDISPDMIKIAQQRIESIKYGPYENKQLKANFITEDPEIYDLGDQVYHAAIFFDSLHHFYNPNALLNRVFRALRPGGKLFIREGIKPPKGSTDELKLIEEMRNFGTLEKPFNHEELKRLLSKVGFKDITAYEFLNLILKRDNDNIVPPISKTEVPETNTLLCSKPGKLFRDSTCPNILKAKISPRNFSIPRKGNTGELLQLILELQNLGDTIWLCEPKSSGGFIQVGTKLLDKNKNIISDTVERTLLPKDILPGQIAVVKHQFHLPDQPGYYWIKIDLVNELIMWFEEANSMLPIGIPDKSNHRKRFKHSLIS